MIATGPKMAKRTAQRIARSLNQARRVLEAWGGPAAWVPAAWVALPEYRGGRLGWVVTVAKIPRLRRR